MLAIFPETRASVSRLNNGGAGSIKVALERWTAAGRRIDITVDIPTDDGTFCLAFENKPYAGDQPGQVEDYLKFLGDEYGSRFLLVYLPPDDREPDESSFSQAARERWRGHFRVLPYAGGVPSLDQWFAACQGVCEADRVRWFLKDAQSFCRHRFGGSTMISEADAHFVAEHLASNPDQMRAALAVHDAWPEVRRRVCKRFLEHLRRKVEERLGEVEGVRVGCKYPRNSWRQVWITRNTWVRYDVPPDWKGRTSIILQSGKGKWRGWYWGVCAAQSIQKMTDSEKRHREAIGAGILKAGLGPIRDGDWWLQWENLQRYGDWRPIVPELQEECEAGGGPITDYYVNGLVGIAKIAIPVIDEVEGREANA